MSRLTISNIDSLCCAPYAALADISNVNFLSNTPADSAQMLSAGESQLSLLSLSEFFNHGGHSALAYGVIARDICSSELITIDGGTFTSALAREWSTTTKLACPLAIWAYNSANQPQLSPAAILPYFEIGLAAAPTYIRDWAQRKAVHCEETQMQNITYRFDSCNLDLLYDFVEFGIYLKKLPNNALEILARSISRPTPCKVVRNNQRISLHEALLLSRSSSLSDLGLAATQHKPRHSYFSPARITTPTSQLELIEDINYYERILSSQASSSEHRLTLCADEIHFLAHYSAIPIQDVLKRLRDAGLTALNAIGGESLALAMREKVSHSILSSPQWLAIHQQAHQLGIRSSAAIEATTLLDWPQYLEHLLCIRTLQDETQGFTSVAVSPSSANSLAIEELLRLFFVTNLFMDNVAEVTISGDTVSPAMHQLFASFGQNVIAGNLGYETLAR